MDLKLRKSQIKWFKHIVIQRWNEGYMAEWSKATQSAWQNNDINFDPKSGLLPVIFSRKITYGFVAQEVRNSMLQTDHNLELKRGRYDQLK